MELPRDRDVARQVRLTFTCWSRRCQATYRCSLGDPIEVGAVRKVQNKAHRVTQGAGTHAALSLDKEQRDTTLLVVTNKSQTGHLEGRLHMQAATALLVRRPSTAAASQEACSQHVITSDTQGGAAMTSLLAAVFQATVRLQHAAYKAAQDMADKLSGLLLTAV